MWAVWDYFQLLKRLQTELTCVALPWVPKGDPQLRRFITEIVLEEETDICEDGATFGSHLELYLRGMRQAGADTGPMERFLARIDRGDHEVPSIHRQGGTPIAAALAAMALEEGAPPAAAAFMSSTVQLAMNGSVAEVAAVFTFGREDVIPHMFVALLPSDEKGGAGQDATNADVASASAAAADVAAQTSIFSYYIKRHIELDGKDHGPLAIRLVESLCGTDGSAGTKANWAAATIASNTALANRAALWDAVHDAPLAHCSAAVASTPPRAK